MLQCSRLQVALLCRLVVYGKFRGSKARGFSLRTWQLLGMLFACLGASDKSEWPLVVGRLWCLVVQLYYEDCSVPSLVVPPENV